jgi:FMN phosphatase YigB (HAD superfamily)
MKIGFDVDEVLYPFVDALRSYAVATNHPCARRTTVPQSWQFYQDWGLTEEGFDDLANEAAEDGFLFSQSPHHGVNRVLQHVRNAGHDVVLVTARYHGPDPLGQTLDWVERWDVPCDYVHVTKGKHLIEMDTFVDDRYDTVLNLRQIGVDAYLLHTPHTPAYTVGAPIVTSLVHYIDRVVPPAHLLKEDVYA